MDEKCQLQSKEGGWLRTRGVSCNLKKKRVAEGEKCQLQSEEGG